MSKLSRDAVAHVTRATHDFQSKGASWRARTQGSRGTEMPKLVVSKRGSVARSWIRAGAFPGDARHLLPRNCCTEAQGIWGTGKHLPPMLPPADAPSLTVSTALAPAAVLGVPGRSSSGPG